MPKSLLPLEKLLGDELLAMDVVEVVVEVQTEGMHCQREGVHGVSKTHVDLALIVTDRDSQCHLNNGHLAHWLGVHPR